MPKSVGKPEIYLLLNMGVKPKEIIAMGYPRSMVYNYNKRFAQAKERFTKLLSNGYRINKKGEPE